MGEHTRLDSSVGWNWFGCCVGCREWLHFSAVDRHCFFLCSGRKWLVFSVWIETKRCFVSGYRNRFDTRVGIKIFFTSSHGVEINLDYMCGLGIDLVLGSRSTLSCFLCGGQNRHRFCLRAENYVDLIYGSKLTWFFVWGLIDLVVCVGGRIWLGLCMLAENCMVLVWALTLCRLCVGKRNWLDFSEKDRTWLDFSGNAWIGLVWV